ncbi:carbohydrate ABC transporter permease [Halosimplex amylolyticum]|uniref:carbohydrate ABC transporter permease n=1 Tax=Halosimplex amylolyticum TaxID=3396616 RepID=UPI003F547817
MSTDTPRFGQALQSDFDTTKLALTLGLFFLVGVTFFPIYILLTLPFKSRSKIFSAPLALPETLDFSRFVTAWNVGGFSQYFMNSLIVVSVSLAAIIVIGALGAFALVQFDFRAERFTLLFLISGLMIPTQVLIIPLYSMMNQLGLLNSFYSLFLVYIAFAMPFSVFLIRQFFLGIPDSYSEAARLDGCSEFQVFWKIYLPLAAPALAALAIYQFVFLWNEFLYVLTFITQDAHRTLPAGLLAFQGRRANEWGLLFAGVIISVLPTVIFLAIFQRQFIRGVTMGMKGE